MKLQNKLIDISLSVLCSNLKILKLYPENPFHSVSFLFVNKCKNISFFFIYIGKYYLDVFENSFFTSIFIFFLEIKYCSAGFGGILSKSELLY